MKVGLPIISINFICFDDIIINKFGTTVIITSYTVKDLRMLLLVFINQKIKMN